MREAFSLGAVGCVSGLANALPEWVEGVYQGAKTQKPTEAEARLAEVASLIGSLAFPLDVAATLQARGIPTGAEKTFVSSATETEFQKVVTQLKPIFQSRGLS